jgi:hypothetical protein
VTVAAKAATGVVGIDGIRLTLDGQPFPFTGLSFFNAIYNPTFNRDPEERRRWLRLFRDNGVNALRLWSQWDFRPPRSFIDVGPTQTMFAESGEIREEHFQTLTVMIGELDRLGMVLELTLFSHEKEPNLPLEVQVRVAHALVGRLVPYRHLILQIWNEKSDGWAQIFEAVKSADPARLVTSAPGVSNVLGDDEQNRTLDLLTPHTIRHSPGVPFWEIAPRQIAGLIDKFGKPVIDDEPARNGPIQFGGIEGGTRPEWHIEAMARVRAVGGYPTYHHDMFQYGYGAPTTPPSGIPDPDFSPFQRKIFDHLRAIKSWD